MKTWQFNVWCKKGLVFQGDVVAETEEEADRKAVEQCRRATKVTQQHGRLTVIYWKVEEHGQVQVRA